MKFLGRVLVLVVVLALVGGLVYTVAKATQPVLSEPLRAATQAGEPRGWAFEPAEDHEAEREPESEAPRRQRRQRGRQQDAKPNRMENHLNLEKGLQGLGSDLVQVGAVAALVVVGDCVLGKARRCTRTPLSRVLLPRKP